jgi:hypothetical protein
MRVVSKYHGFIWAVLLLIMSGCRYGLPSSEIRDMMGVQQGWEQIMVSAENKFLDISRKHEAFMAEVKDTSGGAVLMRQDTLVNLHIGRLGSAYEGAKRRHIYHLKEMRSFLDASEVWLQRINTEGVARQIARRSWQARTTTFKTLYARIQGSEEAFLEIGPDYVRIERLVGS